MTKNKKTEILALLAFKAINNFSEAPMYRASFKILKTLNRRKALSAAKCDEPIKNIERYLGIGCGVIAEGVLE